MPAGIDPIHYDIMRVLAATTDPLTAAEVHRRVVRGTNPSIEGIGRRLKTMRTRQWVERRDCDGKAAWGATDVGRAALARP